MTANECRTKACAASGAPASRIASPTTVATGFPPCGPPSPSCPIRSAVSCLPVAAGFPTCDPPSTPCLPVAAGFSTFDTPARSVSIIRSIGPVSAPAFRIPCKYNSKCDADPPSGRASDSSSSTISLTSRRASASGVGTQGMEVQVSRCCIAFKRLWKSQTAKTWLSINRRSRSAESTRP